VEGLLRARKASNPVQSSACAPLKSSMDLLSGHARNTPLGSWSSKLPYKCGNADTPPAPLPPSTQLSTQLLSAVVQVKTPGSAATDQIHDPIDGSWPSGLKITMWG
jgi:hypothetical protein